MRTRNIPIIVMLTAGLVTSIVMYVNRYDLSVTLVTILIVFFVFYILGLLVKKVLDKYCIPVNPEDAEAKKEQEEETEEKQSNADGSVIEKK